MKLTMQCLMWLGGVLLVAMGQTSAEETLQVSWQTDVNAAWKSTQQLGRPLVVFVTRDQCYYCTQMKERTWSDNAVAAAIGRGYVPLVLDGGVPTQLLKELNVKGYPCTFVISPQAVVVERIEGFVPPAALAAKLEAHAPRQQVLRLVKDP